MLRKKVIYKNTFGEYSVIHVCSHGHVRILELHKKTHELSKSIIGVCKQRCDQKDNWTHKNCKI